MPYDRDGRVKPGHDHQCVNEAYPFFGRWAPPALNTAPQGALRLERLRRRQATMRLTSGTLSAQSRITSGVQACC